ncbi:tRNA 2-selenouridine(34) synthase MnmH [Paenibacillus thiaminolyticus]|uniref:tRNA 2-selenouridine(34) synthase MnmH n=1 Tax=Paenibacillus thiaminolyticus TaxID=49283 RepID=UPI0011623407|nr:tRNA 2-selenouridine(34) synthase MnmH [Paenibacillus thiaminolyticus]MDG0874361.1 tRNA 2-selenouridine(34) synthase MnmH [Paenibacillus thiaminolyticus]NGP57849.1 tRNA 2-selenouridine(34) synthase MnmH [Paenibacillus thiaminolyticus]
MQDISLEQCLEKRAAGATLVDVRSPGEYAEFTIPGSINIPLFTDEERAEIGTIYKQASVEAAKERGLAIASAKLPALYAQFRELKGQVVIYCWRGGMRSRTMATVMSLMGLKTFRLLGGIRSYRRWVQSTLAEYRLQAPCIVLAGHTGTGKTQLLQRLREDGYPVLDLEGLAGHRGSIFGHIGLEPNNQKKFEALLLDELLKLEAEGRPYLLIEGESRRIGKVVLPEFLVEAKRGGTVFTVRMPVQERVRNLMADYQPEQHAEKVKESFEQIRRRMHTPAAREVESALGDGRYDDVAALLLEYYYDPRYEHAALQYDREPIVIDAADVNEAYAKVVPLLRGWNVPQARSV